MKTVELKVELDTQEARERIDELQESISKVYESMSQLEVNLGKINLKINSLADAFFPRRPCPPHHI